MAGTGNHVQVGLAVLAETAMGSEVRVVGSIDALGAWCPWRGVALRTSPGAYPEWSATVCLPVGSHSAEEGVAYKFVICKPDGGVHWEDGPNRWLPPARGGRVEVGLQPFGEAQRIPRPLAERVRTAWRATCAGTLPGDSVVVVGAAEQLGGWEPARGLHLTTTPMTFPWWSGAAKLGPGAFPLEWKLVCLREDGTVLWEPGDNRRLDKLEQASTCLVEVVFGGELEAPRPHCGRPSECFSYPSPSGDDDLIGELHGRATKPQVERIAELLVTRRPSTISVASTAASRDSSRSDHEGLETPVTRPEEAAQDVFLASPLHGEGRLLRSGLATQETADLPNEHAAPPLWLWSGVHQVKKPGGRCEDAHLVSTYGLGVADGVGSMATFAEYGVDAAAYAAEIMWHAGDVLRAGSSAACTRSAPDIARAALVAAEAEVTAYGASTATVLALEGSTVGVSNLGDSGFALLRRAPGGGLSQVARSREQQHSWNCPYQLMRLPRSLAHRVPDGFRADTAADCESYEVEVQPGDLLLLFTDGLSDNLHGHEMRQLLERLVAQADEAPGSHVGLPVPQDLAAALALAAQAKSLDPDAQVPFAESSQKFGYKHQGGKPDDITVVAAWVMQKESHVHW